MPPLIIDAHEHIGTDAPAVIAALEQHDMCVLNICVAHEPGAGWRKQADLFGSLSQERPGRFAWCTTFTLPTPDTFEDPGLACQYASGVIDGLREDFLAGAVACKIWKNIGMELRDHTGHYVMADHPIFAPIYDFLSASGRPVIAHLAEPLACWQPLNPGNPHFHYYSTALQWHMYGKEGVPSHADIIAARDRLVETHPGLTVIGAHLGSQEHDVNEVARRLQRYPNFNVDMSARLGDLLVQDRDVVRRFFVDYHDRILFGTDAVIYDTQFGSEAQHQKAIAAFVASAENYLRYLTTDDVIVVRDLEARGLALPPDLLEDLLRNNALRLFPRLVDRGN